jgi:cation diffusion facilitator family transporter
MEKTKRYQQAKKATIIGAVVNTLLCVMKITGGFFFHSHALVADGFHSFADILTDGMVLIGSKYSSQGADETHPYGHQRIETATTLFLSLILILVGFGIAWDAVHEIIDKSHDMPAMLALPVAIISILANELLFHYTHAVGKAIQSDLIIANAWHRRSDAASSLVVLFGLIGSYFSYVGLDAIAAVIVSILIIKMGWDYGWNSVKELVDTAIAPEMLEQIESIVLNIHGVHKIHQLRSRSMAGDIFIDLHIQVSPWLTVSEGHYIAQHVHNAVIEHIPTVKDVTVHVDPEDDETSSPSLHLPNRAVLEKNLLHSWRAQSPEIEYWMLNYLDGTLTIDLFCNKLPADEQLAAFQQELKQLTHGSHIRFFIINR